MDWRAGRTALEPLHELEAGAVRPARQSIDVHGTVDPGAGEARLQQLVVAQHRRVRVRGPVDLGEIDGARPRAIEEQTCHGAIARVFYCLEVQRERRVQPLHELFAAVALRAGRLLQHLVRSAARRSPLTRVVCWLARV